MSPRITVTLLGLLITLTALVTPPTLAQKGGLAPIISDYYLLGGVENGQWLDAATTLTRLTGNERYRVYTPKGYVGTGRASFPSGYYYPCNSGQPMDFTPRPKSDVFVAVASSWQPMPRATRIYSNNSSVYRKIIADLLHAQGITNPDVRLTQIIRVDLEGDGVDEVLISATRFIEDSDLARAGDYSLVVLRKIIDGKVATITLRANYYTQDDDLADPATYSIAGILDLSGDGTMEVVVDHHIFTTTGSDVFQIAGGTITQVLRASCGP